MPSTRRSGQTTGADQIHQEGTTSSLQGLQECESRDAGEGMGMELWDVRSLRLRMGVGKGEETTSSLQGFTKFSLSKADLIYTVEVGSLHTP